MTSAVVRRYVVGKVRVYLAEEILGGGVGVRASPPPPPSHTIRSRLLRAPSRAAPGAQRGRCCCKPVCRPVRLRGLPGRALFWGDWCSPRRFSVFTAELRGERVCSPRTLLPNHVCSPRRLRGQHTCSPRRLRGEHACSAPTILRPDAVASSLQRQILGEQEGGAGVARAWRGRGAGYRLRLGMSGAGMALAWRGHFLFSQGQ
eukprot:gene24176-biopygen4389